MFEGQARSGPHFHTVEEMIRLRMFAIAAGYEDADDCDWLRHDPIFKMAVGRLPASGEPLCRPQRHGKSQPGFKCQIGSTS